MEELDIYQKMTEIASPEAFVLMTGSEWAQKIADHKAWLGSIRRERPNPADHYKVAVYIRYFNQTRYENYLEHHKKQFLDTINLCPNWELTGFYIDEGSVAPNMESAPEWSRLLTDAMDGKFNLILTQKVGNVSRKPYEVAFCSRILAQQKPPIGIYFISEDIFTLASYYQEDMKDTFFLPCADWKLLEEADDD